MNEDVYCKKHIKFDLSAGTDKSQEAKINTCTTVHREGSSVAE